MSACLIGATEDTPAGSWSNASNSVIVRIEPCGGAKWCGTVEWASAAAKADAARGGTPRLLGTVVIRDFVHNANDRWRGRLFVPDQNLHAHGTLRRISDTRIEIRGCVMVVVCKSEVWTMIADRQAGGR